MYYLKAVDAAIGQQRAAAVEGMMMAIAGCFGGEGGGQSVENYIAALRGNGTD